MSEYAKSYYGVPSDLGRIVTYQGRRGVIAEDRGNYVGVNFDSNKPGVISNIHPTDEHLEYHGMGKVRKPTRSQQKYQDYLNNDGYDSFAEFIGVEPKCWWQR